MSAFDDYQEDYWAFVSAGLLDPTESSFDDFVLEGGAACMTAQDCEAIGYVFDKPKPVGDKGKK